MLEKGRLYSLRKDGTKDLLYFKIKNKRFLLGSSEHCTLRIYIDGIFPEHCILSFGGQGKAYLEPLHPLASTLVNGIKIRHKVRLEDNDVVRILTREFLFAYLPDGLSRNVSLERPILSYSKQVEPAQKFETLTLGKIRETSQPFRESSVSNIHCIPMKQICIIESNLFKDISEYLLKFMHQEPVNNLCEKMNAQEIYSYSDKSLIKEMNQYFKESPEERRNLALKLYEFISFLKELLNRNKEYLYDLWLVLESVLKYCNARADKDILFLPLKSLNLKGAMAVHKKSLQSRISSCTSENLLPVSDTVSENKNNCINNLEVSVSSNSKRYEQKQNQFSSRKTSISYKKRVSLAVKRYHLRKRKSMMIAKAEGIESVENIELSGEKPQMKDICTEINSDKQDVVLNLEKLQITRTKRKRGYKKEKKELQNEDNLKIEQDINIEVVKDYIGKLNTSEQKKEKRRKKAPPKDIDLTLDLEKENIAKLTDLSSGNQILREQKQTEGKHSSKDKGLKQESIKYPAGEQTTNAKLTETKATKRSYKRKKKEANHTALKDEIETKSIHDSCMKQNTSKLKKGSYKKKNVSLEKSDSSIANNSNDKSTPECDTQLSRCQRITRSMAKKHH